MQTGHGRRPTGAQSGGGGVLRLSMTAPTSTSTSLAASATASASPAVHQSCMRQSVRPAVRHSVEHVAASRDTDEDAVDARDTKLPEAGAGKEVCVCVWGGGRSDAHDAAASCV